MRKGFVQARRFAVVCHRWMGVMFCLLFTWWFFSGIFMMYTDFPSVGPEDRLAHAAVLKASMIKLSPAEAWTRVGEQGSPAGAEAAMFNGRPVYRFDSGGGRRHRPPAIVYADNGSLQKKYSPAQLLQVASDWAAKPATQATVESVTKPDQWTVQGSLRNLRPLWRYTFADGQQVYVSGDDGMVVQYTTARSRLLAYLGPIPHWLYFTPLRLKQRLWSNLIVWASALGTLAALLGLIVGIWMYSPSGRYRVRGSAVRVPYEGQKRLHMIFGLFFGITVCSWAFSGMLSMDPFATQSGGAPATPMEARLEAAFEPGEFSLRKYEPKSPLKALAETEGLPIRELRFTSFDGEPVYIASVAPGETRIIPISGMPKAEFASSRIFEIVKKAAQPAEVVEKKVLTHYDRYYLSRGRELPLPVLFVRIGDAEDSRFYIDQRTGRILAQHNRQASWTERWLYHGLHSLNFPWLYNYRPAWDIVVMSLMLGGLTLCITSVAIAWQLLFRKVRLSRAGQRLPSA